MTGSKLPAKRGDGLCWFAYLINGEYLPASDPAALPTSAWSIAVANANADVPDNITSITYRFVLRQLVIFDGFQLNVAVWAIDVVKPVEEVPQCKRDADTK
jgi:hypothetical protein